MSRVFRHIIFWVSYLLIILYSELFLSASFQKDFSFAVASNEIYSQLVLLIAKFLLVYYFIFWLLPEWSLENKKRNVLLKALLAFGIATIMQRIITQEIIWEHIYKQTPEMTWPNFVARIIYSFLDLLQITAVASAIKLIRLRLEQSKKEKEIIQEKLSAELKHLKSQINPHFLFNSLNSIFSLARVRSEKTADSVLGLSSILRYTLYESEKKITSLENELNVIEEYISLQKIRFGDRLKIHFHVSADRANNSISPLLLLPVIENAFKHGTSAETGDIIIQITISVNDGRLELTTQNPFEANTQRTDGIGLANIRRQLELQYEDYQLTHQPSGNNFTTVLIINLHSFRQ
jgi:two-component system, LytTR family, sensor kinase